MKRIINRILDWACLLLLVASTAVQLDTQIQNYGWFTFLTFPLFIAIAAVSVGVLFILSRYVAYILISRKFTGFKSSCLGGGKCEGEKD